MDRVDQSNRERQKCKLLQYLMTSCIFCGIMKSAESNCVKYRSVCRLHENNCFAIVFRTVHGIICLRNSLSLLSGNIKVFVLFNSIDKFNPRLGELLFWSRAFAAFENTLTYTHGCWFLFIFQNVLPPLKEWLIHYMNSGKSTITTQKWALIGRLLAQPHGSFTPPAVCRSPTHCLRRF